MSFWKYVLDGLESRLYEHKRHYCREKDYNFVLFYNIRTPRHNDMRYNNFISSIVTLRLRFVFYSSA